MTRSPAPRQRLARAGRALALLAALLLAGTAEATGDRAPGSGLAQVTLAGDMVSYQLTLALDGLPPQAAQVLGRAMNRDMGGAETVAAWMGEHVRVSAGGQACKPVRFLMQGSAAGQSSASVEVGFRCPDPTGTLEIGDQLAAVFGDDYRTVVSLLGADGGTQQPLLQDDSRVARFDIGSATAPVGWFDLFRLGARQAATRFDHLLFLAALVLGSRRPLHAVAAVTAFTIAHSIALAMSVFGHLPVAPAIVEPLVAVSVIGAGVRMLAGGRRDRAGWLAGLGPGVCLGLVCGLIHGLGFAGRLAALALPRQSLPRALTGLNLGVEAAQLALVLVIAPLCWWLWRRPAGALPARVIAAAVMAAGVGWLVQPLLVQ